MSTTVAYTEADVRTFVDALSYLVPDRKPQVSTSRYEISFPKLASRETIKGKSCPD